MAIIIADPETGQIGISDYRVYASAVARVVILRAVQSAGTIQLLEPEWDTSDVDTLYFVWDEFVSNAAGGIAESEWTLPEGWEGDQDQFDITLEYQGVTYYRVTAIRLSTTQLFNKYRMANRITMGNGSQYERSCDIMVRQL
jgi:hypothetical protein